MDALKALKTPAALALTALLLTACGGGGGDRATVETSLRQYLAFGPQGFAFPIGAGPPSVKDHGCKDLHRKFTLRDLPLPGSTKLKKGERYSAWVCVIRFSRLTLPAAVLVDDSKEVVWAWAGSSSSAPTPGPARTYTG